MKKYLPIFICIELLIAAVTSPVVAQERTFDFNQAYNDYLYTYNQYRLTHNEYIVARQSYLSYQTLTSKTEALNKTLKMLQLRDEAIRTYLTALRLKLAQTTGIANYELNSLYLKLDNEVSWYASHRENLSSAGSLEDLLESSDEAQGRYPQTEVFIYQTLGTILTGKETALRDQIDAQLENLKTKVAEIREKGDKKTTVAERWLLEADNRLTRSYEKQELSLQILAKMKSYDQSKSQVYSRAQFSIEESHQYLKETISYLKELIREIKSAD